MKLEELLSEEMERERGKERRGEEIGRERGRIVQESQPLSLLFFLSGSHIPLLGLFLFLGWFTLGQNPFGLFQVGRKPQKLCYPCGMHALHGRAR